MSELIEKTARRLAILYFNETRPEIDERFPSAAQYAEEKWREFADEARAAIAEVAEWVQTQGHEGEADYLITLLHLQLEQPK